MLIGKEIRALVDLGKKVQEIRQATAQEIIGEFEIYLRYADKDYWQISKERVEQIKEKYGVQG